MTKFVYAVFAAILRDAAARLLRMRAFFVARSLDPHGEEAPLGAVSNHEARIVPALKERCPERAENSGVF
jgi:hypothetical protein